MLRALAFVKILLIVFNFSTAQAYFVGLLGDKVLDLSKPTHILVSGRGTDLGLLPQHSALSVGLRMKAANPTVQVVLLSVFENAENEAKLVQRGITFWKRNETVKFHTDTILPEILKFPKIESLHFFGHNSPTLGTQSDAAGFRFDFMKSPVLQIKKNLTANSYIYIHGCNAGWIIAPYLSDKLGVPVAGAFTSTRFERMHSLDNFYVFDPTKVPERTPGKPNLDWATVNKLSFAAPWSCEMGGCFRMRPSNVGYNGHWGDMSNAGLGFFKFFCVKNDDQDCTRRMALALINELTTKPLTVNSSRQDFIEAAKDAVCPPSKSREATNVCYQAMQTALDGGTKEFTSLLAGPAIQCDMKSCQTVLTCQKVDGVWQAGSCHATNTGPKNTTTQANEFLAYVRGYDALQTIR